MTKAAAKPPGRPDDGARLARLPIDRLLPNPANPRKHGEDQLTRLMAALQRDGQTKPVLARAENLMLIAGHGVTEAARRLQWTEIAVLLLDVDQATADRIMLADNRLGELSQTDQARVTELLRGIDPMDYFATGFSADEVEKLLAEMEEELELREIDVSEVGDEFWATVRGPLPRQATVLARLKTLLAEYPDVKVELGVISLE